MADWEPDFRRTPQGYRKRPFEQSMVFFRSKHRRFKPQQHRVWLQHISNRVNTAEKQIPLIVKEIEAGKSYYDRVVFLCKDLENALKFFYKEQNIKILPFGSAVMDLALKDSDVDLFLDFGGELPLPADEFTKSLKKIMYKTRLVRRANAILASVPIVKCETKSGMNCDISFLNRLGVMNSKLIKFLLEIDERIRPMILILKFLLKSRELIAKNGITSYTLIILTIFFLQQLKMVPSIKELQDLSTAKDIVAGWDTSFSTQLTECNIEKHSDYSIVDLLVQFFKFYAKFEFAFYIISPFTGKAYLKPIFSESKYTPQEFCTYRENITNETHTPFELDKFMCVQDPFNHSRNISRAITQTKLFQFQSICEKSFEMCEEELQKNNNKGYKSKFFEKLFTRNMEINEKRKMFNKRFITVHTGKFMDNKYIDPCSEDILRNNWSKTITEKLIDILKRVLMCKVNEVPKEKYDEKSMDLNNLNVVAVLDCEFECFDLLTKKRNKVKQTLKLDEISSLLDQEELISKLIIEGGVDDSYEKPYKFNAICCVKKGPTCFCVNIEHKDGKGILKEVDEQFNRFLKFRLLKFITS